MDVAVGQATREAEALKQAVFGDLGKREMEFWGLDGLVKESVGVWGWRQRRGEGVFGEVVESDFW